jgi:hypothetical protein
MRLKRIKREKGDELVESIDCVAIEQWISAIAKCADLFNKWRQRRVWLWRFAVSQKLAKTNEAETVERRSISRKIKSNQLMTHSSPKTTEIYLERGPQALTDDDFQAVSAPFTLRKLLAAK